MTRYFYGCEPDRPDSRDLLLHERVTLPAAATLPASVDLRRSGHFAWLHYDQGQLGSCTANAIAGAVRFAGLVQGLADVDPSRLWIYYKERVIEGSVDTDAGAELRDGLKVVATEGWPAEAEWPYDINRFADVPTSAVDKDALADRATTYMRVLVTADAIRQALAAGYAVVVGFDVYESFESDQVASTGVVPMPATSEALLGGHAVLCVGYDDASQRFTCRNSWGSNWGQGGDFTMPYAYLGDPSLANDFWAIQVVSEGGNPQPTPTPTPAPTPVPVPPPPPAPPPPPEGLLTWLEDEAEHLPEPVRDWIEGVLHHIADVGGKTGT